MMKKRKLTTLVLAGITGGMLTIQQLPAENAEKDKDHADTNAKERDASDGNMNYHLMDEDELFLELTPEGQKLYNALTPEGKKLARYVASQRCNATNPCSGLNACASDGHDCAGKGSCKGTGKCALSDKNLAVKLVSQKMAKKRTETLEKDTHSQQK